MKAEEALSLSDEVLAQLYSEWSETNYGAGWIGGGESEFVRYLLILGDGTRPLERYESESIATIRELLRNQVGVFNP